MAARVGTPSPNLHLCGVVSSRKQVSRGSGSVSDSKLSPQIVGSAQSETDLGSRKVKFLVEKRVLIASHGKPCRRQASVGCVTSASGDNEGAGVSNSNSIAGADEFRTAEEEAECRSDGTEASAQLGRRMLLGTLFTVVALSSLDKPGFALSEAKGGSDKGKSKAGASGEKGKSENAGPPQIGEKWKLSRVYDATVLGEPMAVGGERSRVWQKLLQARVVYLGKAERVPDTDDRVPLNHEP